MYGNYLPILKEYLQLKPDDVMLDIGGGTGWVADTLAKAAGLSEPVVCVDPSAEMVKRAKQRGVIGVQATAEEFFTLPQAKLFSKVLIVAAMHHFSDPRAVFKGIWDSLSPGGSCVVLGYSPECAWPIFRALRNHVATKLCRNEEDEVTALLQASANFDVQTKKMTIQHKIPKAQWYKMIRARFVSPLHYLTDQEIENGIEELEREEFQGLGDDDVITFDDAIFVALAHKTMD